MFPFSQRPRIRARPQLLVHRGRRGDGVAILWQQAATRELSHANLSPFHEREDSIDPNRLICSTADEAGGEDGPEEEGGGVFSIL